MRILLGVHAFPPRATAGVEVYTLRLARALLELGHEVLVLSAVHDLADEPGAVRRRVQDGVDVVEVVNVHHRGTLEATYDDPDVDRAAATVCAEFRPQVVHLQHLLNLSIGVIRAARASRARVLLTLHDYWLSCPRDGQRMRADGALCATLDHATCARCLATSPYLVPPVQRGLAGALRQAGAGRALHRFHDALPGAAELVLGILQRASPAPTGLAEAMDLRAERLRAALDDVDLLLSPTRFVRDRALEFGVAEGKLRVVPYGAVLAPTAARRAGARPRLGYIGTLAPHKGVHVLIQAFRRIEDAALTLDIHGSLGVQPAYVEALRRGAAVDPRIRFHGAFPEGGQRRILGGLDALVVPSLWWENSPLTALEALAAGVPVVAARTGGVPELIDDGVSGVLVEPGDVAALAAALGDVATGRVLGGPLGALSMKTVEAGARELVALYAALGP
jgi:glycosyltransferase involved in cell wall biosynthesis